MKTRIPVMLFMIVLWSSVAWGSVGIEELEAQLETVSGAERAEVLNTLAEAYKEESPKKTLAYSQEALDIAREHDLPTQEAAALEHIGMSFYTTGKYDTALNYVQQALEKQKTLENKAGVASAFHTIGLIYRDKGEHLQALESCSQALQIYEELAAQEQMADILETIGQIYIQAEEYEKALSSYQRTLTVSRELGDDSIIQSTYRYLAEMSFATGDIKQGQEYYTIYETILDEQHAAALTDLQEHLQEQQAMQQQAWKQQTLTLQKQLKNSSLKLRIIMFLAVLCIFPLAGVLAFVLYRWRQEIQQSQTKLAEAKTRLEDLLLNTVPAKIAQDLQESGKTHPQLFKHVTVCFCDLFEFTKISASLEPKSLVAELNTMFTAFDEIIDGHDCERLKTVGDAYLYVCGMPEPNSNHAENVIRSAYEILQYLKKRNQYANMQWQIQIGVHTGHVVGGVVGLKKYVYDVFGDTINIASAMKNASEPMRINISKTTYEEIRHTFDCVGRAPIEVKGKGKMNMYFVEGFYPPDDEELELDEETEPEERIDFTDTHFEE